MTAVIYARYSSDNQREESIEWCCTRKVDIGNSKSQYIAKDKQEARKAGKAQGHGGVHPVQSQGQVSNTVLTGIFCDMQSNDVAND